MCVCVCVGVGGCMCVCEGVCGGKGVIVKLGIHFFLQFKLFGQCGLAVCMGSCHKVAG